MNPTAQDPHQRSIGPLRILLALALGAVSALAVGQSPWPDEAPESWGLAILDVETTGLDPATHEMIDIGMIYTTLEGREVDRLFLRIQPLHPERASPIARSINGFSADRWDELGALDPEQAVEQILAFHRRHAEQRRFILTAYNAPFDRAFLDALLQRHDESIEAMYTYFVLDLPSMAYGLGATALVNDDVAAEFGVDPETDDPLEHTGLSGAEWNLALYRAMRSRSVPSDDADRPGAR